MNSVVVTTIISVIVFLLVVLIHEFGHFSLAKLVGIKVNEFSIGMGPSLFSKTKGETLYSLRLLPLGGFCAMEGEDDGSEDPRSFEKASVFKRMMVIFAGPLMNFILALIVLFVIGIMSGYQTTTIGSFSENSNAKNAGMEIGDKIVSVNNKNITEFSDIITIIKNDDDGIVEIKVKRGEKILDFNIKTNDKSQIGVGGKVERSFIGAFRYAFKTFFMILGLMFNFLASVFKGKIGLKDVSGPVGIVGEIGNAVNAGLMNVLLLFSLININLGFFNLLPIPALDGSKIVLLIIEGLRGKPIKKEKEGIINLIGFAFLIGLIVIVTFKDIASLLGFR